MRRRQLVRFMLAAFCGALSLGGEPARTAFAHTPPITNSTALAERCADHIDFKPVHATLDMSMHGATSSGFKVAMTPLSWWAYAPSNGASDFCDQMAYVRVKFARNTYTYFESSWESTDSDFTNAGFQPPDFCQHSSSEMALFGKRVETGQWELMWVYTNETDGNYAQASTRIFGSPPASVKDYCSHSPEWAPQIIDYGMRRFLVDPWDDAAPGMYSDYRLVAQNWMHNHEGVTTTDCQRDSCYYPIKLYAWTWPN